MLASLLYIVLRRLLQLVALMSGTTTAIHRIEGLASSRHGRHRSCAWPVQSSPVESADGTDWEG